jgi:hypothetical protein
MNRYLRCALSYRDLFVRGRGLSHRHFLLPGTLFHSYVSAGLDVIDKICISFVNSRDIVTIPRSSNSKRS